MKNVALIIALTLIASGCTLTGSTASQARASEPAPADHFGDPTFEHETATAEAEPSPEAPEAAVVDTGKTVPAVIEPEVDADLKAGTEAFEGGKLREARVLLTGALNNQLEEAGEKQALDMLRAINRKLFLSAGEGGDLKMYTVKSGDSLGKIAQTQNTTAEMIQRLNGLKDSRINIGQELKILGGKFELVVRKQRCSMDLLLDGAFIQRYEVGLGLGGSTPLGEFTVKNRIPQPADGSYPYGHEKHRLGSRWLGLKSDAGHKGYGIHGCRAEEEVLIPGECSQGCVRMKAGDVEEVYDIIPVGTRLVVIER
ncbi:MAG: LysM peptidoglycan-binding domain-containing protein [Planctomycetes bacterium]|nr:LysM peptidoglycan-binding domain-containing protein [Planctomycetota bacterium]